MSSFRYFYPQFLAHENPKNVHKNEQQSSNNSKPAVHIVVSFNIGMNFPIIYSFLSALLAVLGSQGIVVKCTTTIFNSGEQLITVFIQLWNENKQTAREPSF